ncbi:MAG TPA: hypothetical protein VGE52_01365 [Pirellulales bacterium]
MLHDPLVGVESSASDSSQSAKPRWRVWLARAVALVDWSARIAVAIALVFTGWTTYRGLRTLAGGDPGESASAPQWESHAPAPAAALSDRWRFADETRLVEREPATREQLDALLAEFAASSDSGEVETNDGDAEKATLATAAAPLASALRASLGLNKAGEQGGATWRFERDGLIAWGGPRRQGSEAQRLVAGVAIPSADGRTWTVWRMTESPDPTAARPRLLPFPASARCVATQRDERDDPTLEMISFAAAKEISDPAEAIDWTPLEDVWRAAGWKVENPRGDDSSRLCTRTGDAIWSQSLQHNLIVVSRSEESIR